VRSALTNLSADMAHSGGEELTGGTYDVDDPLQGGAGSGGDSTIALNNSGGGITTLDATVNLIGATSTMTANGIALSSSLLDIASAGALSLLYGSNSDSAQVFNDSANPLEVAGTVNLNGGVLDAQSLTIDNGGILTGQGAFSSGTAEAAEVSGAIINNGSLVAAGALSGLLDPTFVVEGAISGTGAISIAGDSTLELSGSVGAGQTITFANSQTTGDETLQIDATAVGSGQSFQSLIAGFGTSDIIDLANLGGATGYTFADDVLTLNLSGGGSASLALQGLNSDTAFDLSSFGANGTQIAVHHA
jgi:hypothetical protein